MSENDIDKIVIARVLGSPIREKFYIQVGMMGLAVSPTSPPEILDSASPHASAADVLPWNVTDFE